jgi:probable HAF family extracellular repeat protein
MEGSSIFQRLCAAAVMCVAPSAFAQTYTVSPLGTLGGTVSVANAINVQGNIVGAGTTVQGPGHAFVSDGIGISDLGTLISTSTAMSTANGISATGEVVGISTATAAGDSHGFRWTSTGGMQDLGTLPGGSASSAMGVNSAGQIVGYGATGAAPTAHAVLWQQGWGAGQWIATDLGTLAGATGGLSQANAINNAWSPQVVGFSILSDNASYHAFLWQSGTMTDLGSLGGAISIAHAINDGGLIVGGSLNGSGKRHAFTIQAGGGNPMQDIGTLVGAKGVFSEAYAVNSSGAIVGASVHNTTTTDTHAFIYQNGAMKDLNNMIPAKSGWVLTSATGIDDAGEIAGTGIYNGATMAFRLEPKHFAYATSSNGTVSTFSISNGVLSPVGGAVASTAAANAIAVAPSGKYVFLVEAAVQQITVYSSNAGVLTQVGAFPFNVFVKKGDLAFALSANGKYAYLASAVANTIALYSVNNGVLAASPAIAQTGPFPTAVALDEAGKYAYVANGNGNSIWSYSIGTGGALTLVGSVATGANPQSVAVTPLGQFVYAVNGQDNTLSMYQSTGGVLTSLGSIPTGALPSQVVVAPSGKYVYVMNAGANSISGYSVDGATGKLSGLSTVATGNQPVAISVERGGKHVYVENRADGTIWTYSVGGDGTLKFLRSNGGVALENGLALH